MPYDPTEAQKKAFAENEADFRSLDEHLGRVRETARVRLTDSGLGGHDPGDHIRCLSCPCPDFQAGGPLGACKRGSCRHPIGDHDLPT
ncbi:MULTISPECIES: hypothetical protein [unclassified Streptomyces]|uniref:hypothetical protein n=1 Tax=unclassified Streptomyces TaxID=2593676 RepID=UPI00070A82DB|nr:MULTISPECIES: hypothetical protein [unclassified Streptomyces]KRD06222.1 hypothetical protein ASE41_31955 [Streptomyces sp. Root264]